MCELHVVTFSVSLVGLIRSVGELYKSIHSETLDCKLLCSFRNIGMLPLLMFE